MSRLGRNQQGSTIAFPSPRHRLYREEPGGDSADTACLLGLDSKCGTPGGQQADLGVRPAPQPLPNSLRRGHEKDPPALLCPNWDQLWAPQSKHKDWRVQGGTRGRRGVWSILVTRRRSAGAWSWRREAEGDVTNGSVSLEAFEAAWDAVTCSGWAGLDDVQRSPGLCG